MNSTLSFVLLIRRNSWCYCTNLCNEMVFIARQAACRGDLRESGLIWGQQGWGKVKGAWKERIWGSGCDKTTIRCSVYMTAIHNFTHKMIFSWKRIRRAMAVHSFMRYKRVFLYCHYVGSHVLYNSENCGFRVWTWFFSSFCMRAMSITHQKGLNRKCATSLHTQLKQIHYG